MPANIRLVTTDHPQADALLDSMVNLHASCILNDHTMATFIPPLSRDRMRQRWRTFMEQASKAERVILVSIASPAARDQPPYHVKIPFDTTEWPILSPTEEVSGVVSLSMPASETGPFRGLVQNLFVSPYHRRHGTATQLLDELERQALRHDRWSLMLDTMQGSAAEPMYGKLGWNKLGVVDDYGKDPRDGRLLNEVFFWKDLRGRKQ